MKNVLIKNNFITIALFIISVLVLYGFLNRDAPSVVHTNLENIPYVIDEYVGVDDYFEQGVYDELNADKHIYRHYKNKYGKTITLYIGYYGTKKGGRTPHNPYGCLPASGWSIILEDKIPIQNTGYSFQPELNRIISKKGNVLNSILHWYQSDKDDVLTTGLQQNIHRMKMRTFKNRNDGAYIQLSILTDDKNIKTDTKNLVNFSRSLLKLLPKYWPIEKILS